MCGVAGIYAYRESAPEPSMAELQRIRDRMTMRGPDGLGAWRSDDGRIALGHRRLSIIDLSTRAAQPMLSADGRLAITFNGEIYNHRALRMWLAREQRRPFASDSDTEVLLHMYEARGEAMLDELRGMFAFGLWDARKAALWLARDALGIKPLYYADSDGVVRFASQVKALLAGGALSRGVDPAAIAGLLMLGSVPEPRTIHAAVQALPAGSSLWCDERGVMTPHTWFDVGEVFRAGAAIRAQHDDDTKQARLCEAVTASVRDHLVADVPVGAFLSSGIDSGTLAALMGELGEGVPAAVTIAFDEFRGSDSDEAPLATQLANAHGIEHSTRVVARDELEADLPSILEAMDQPSIDGLNTWFASKAARERGLKVAVSGLGGDELFGGYPAFRDVPRMVRAAALPARLPLLGRAFRTTAAPVLALTKLSPKLAGLIELGGTWAGSYLLRRGLFMPWELSHLIEPELAREGLRQLDLLSHIADTIEPDPGTDFGRVATLEASLYMRNQLLRDTDWASMAHALEVRTPLVDAELLRAVAPLVVHGDRMRLKQALARCPSKPLPDAIVRRRKTGFTTPIAGWLQQSDALAAWRRVPSLARDGVHWSRRFAYALAEHWLAA